MRKAGIYDPYLDILGGGERYTMTVAECLVKHGWHVDIFWGDKSIRTRVVKRFGLKLDRVNFVPNIFPSSNLLKKLGKSRIYDLIFYLSDGSIPFLSAKKNILHFQVPFHDVGGKKTLNKVKLKKINEVVCNSRFTKKFIDQEYGVRSKVIYPPVSIVEFKPTKKANVILCVGRFTDLLHTKRQDILVDGFKQMIEADKSGYLGGWKLILAGGDEEGKSFVAKLRKQIRGCPIEIATNIPFAGLKDLYGKAKIFWTAAGFGVDQEEEPEKVEHFGITTVEAMAAGCVPVVIDKGGQQEIVVDGQNGLLWKSKKELAGETLKLVKDQRLWQRLAKAAQKRALDFSQERFCREIRRLAE